MFGVMQLPREAAAVVDVENRPHEQQQQQQQQQQPQPQHVQPPCGDGQHILSPKHEENYNNNNNNNNNNGSSDVSFTPFR